MKGVMKYRTLGVVAKRGLCEGVVVSIVPILVV